MGPFKPAELRRTFIHLVLVIAICTGGTVVWAPLVSAATYPDSITVDIHTVPSFLVVDLVHSEATPGQGVAGSFTITNPLTAFYLSYQTATGAAAFHPDASSWVWHQVGIIPPGETLHFDVAFSDTDQVIDLAANLYDPVAITVSLLVPLLKKAPQLAGVSSSRIIQAMGNIGEIVNTCQDLKDVASAALAIGQDPLSWRTPYHVTEIANGVLEFVKSERGKQWIASIFANLGEAGAEETARYISNWLVVYQVAKFTADVLVYLGISLVYGHNSTSRITITPSTYGPGMPPAPPALKAPVGLRVSRQPLLEWGPSLRAVGYWVEVSDDAGFARPFLQQGVDTTSLLLPHVLDNGSTFYWRVFAINSYGNRSAANVGVFYTGPVEYTPPPSEASPAIDAATFVVDLTLVDGSAVSPGQALTKTWRVRNSGTSTWDGYTLRFLSGNRMGGSSSVPIPTTPPGQTVDISISLQAPEAAGVISGYWQIVNRDGAHVPEGKLWITVEVVGSSESIAHIAALSADPPSPSSASMVRVYARVNPWPAFRAMRLRIGDRVIEEIGATEHTFEWHTESFGPGDHALVLEVADQSDTSWSRPERKVLAYHLYANVSPVNHAPNRPSPASPYDWYVYYSGNTAALCAQHSGDSDGDAISGYYFQIFDSVQNWESGWTSSNCVTTSALGPYTYQWRVRVRDSRGAESDWSEPWHFTLVNPNLSVSELYFQPLDGASEQVRIRACTTGQGGVNITLRVSVNDATDGSGNGTWHIIKELGVPCFNEVDAPVWHTLDYGDGPHRVRVEARGAGTGWDGAAVREEVYTLPYRRPASPRVVAPMPFSGRGDDPVYLASGTVTFRWQSALRASEYTLHVSTSTVLQDDPAPVFRQTLDSWATEQTITLPQDYPTLYWQVTASNSAGSTTSGRYRFGIDRAAPTCSVSPLPGETTSTAFLVFWTGSDDVSGVRTASVQVLDSSRGDWQDWLIDVPAEQTQESFTGQPGHHYAFRCAATDHAGNAGGYPPDAQATTFVTYANEPDGPDLALLSMQAYPQDGHTFDQGAIIQAIVQNVGSAATANGFYTDFYVNRVPLGPGDLSGSVRFLVNEPIAAGQIVTLTTVLDGPNTLFVPTASLAPMEESSVTVYGQTDSLGAVSDASRANNISASGVTICTTTPDAFEPDEQAGNAAWLPVGGKQERNFHAPEDKDWVRLDLAEGRVYGIITSDLAAAADTYLYLYSGDGTTLLAADDDYSESLASRITFAPPATGTYYLLVQHWNPSSGGCANSYTVSLRDETTAPGADHGLSLPLIVRNH